MSDVGDGIDWTRIALTPIEAEDLESVHAWQNDPEIRDLIMGFRGPVRRETTADWIRNLSDQNLKTRAVFAIRSDGAIRGVAQLHGIDWLQRSAILGIFVGDRNDRGAGLGRGAVALLLDYAFRGLDLHRVSLEVLASNGPARRLYEKLGFASEGVLRQAFLRAGVREDVALYGLLSSEWTFVPPAAARRLVSERPSSQG
ncbi:MULTISPECIES: GNAT family N-acetyltransferase [unclassified Phenylobacterium]|uniref:GNAT family N-acetyltransferase n=1 Tax=unclassified Phenylobacterium TaxID=2640670 RepID=UPI00083AE5B3|nr:MULTISPECIES: GNAT family protein [unclassified Phenylobacterium]